MEPTLLRPDRKGSYLSLAFGIVCAAIGASMVASGSTAGVVVLVLAAIGLYAGVAGFVPGLGLRLDAQGFYLTSLGKSWGASWVETDGFTPARVRVGRRADVDVVEVRYQAGIGDRREPQHLLGRFLGVDERYLIAGYGGLSNTQLAELLEKFRTASV
jgi:hypothetical protein